MFVRLPSGVFIVENKVPRDEGGASEEVPAYRASHLSVTGEVMLVRV